MVANKAIMTLRFWFGLLNSLVTLLVRSQPYRDSYIVHIFL